MHHPHCPYCDGQATLLGVLGHTQHFRCRDCGADFSKTPARRQRTSRPATAQEVQVYHARLAVAAGRVSFHVQE
jgi:transposase-like protein